MKVEFSIQYNDGYDTTSQPMTDDIAFLWFKGKHELIEYIDCMCIAMHGESFTLHDKFPLETVCYKSNFFKTKLVPSYNSKVVNDSNLGYPDNFKWRNWPHYLSDINNMPDGISVSTTPEVMGNFEYRYSAVEQKHTKHMNVEFRISKEYSQRVNGARTRYLKHQDVLNALLERIPFHLAGPEKTLTYLDVGRHGVAFEDFWCILHQESNETYFSEFQLQPLTNKFECFVFVNVLLDYVFEQKKNRLTFHNVSVQLGSKNTISNECAYAHLDIWFSEKSGNKNLNCW